MKHLPPFILWFFLLFALTDCRNKSIQYKAVSIKRKDTVKSYDSQSTRGGNEINEAPSLSINNALQNRLYGTWVVVKYSHSQLIKSDTNEEWRKYRGKEIFLSSNLAVIFEDSCKFPNYKMSRQNAFWYFYNGFRERSSIGIKEDTITIIELGCKEEYSHNSKDSPLFNTDIIISFQNDIILYESGLFLYLKRIK